MDGRVCSPLIYHLTILKLLCLWFTDSLMERVENIFLPVCAEVGETCQTWIVCCWFDSYLRHHFLLTLLRNPPSTVPHGEYSMLLWRGWWVHKIFHCQFGVSRYAANILSTSDCEQLDFFYLFIWGWWDITLSSNSLCIKAEPVFILTHFSTCILQLNLSCPFFTVFLKVFFHAFLPLFYKTAEDMTGKGKSNPQPLPKTFCAISLCVSFRKSSSPSTWGPQKTSHSESNF